jgi:aspartate aminotransferase
MPEVSTRIASAPESATVRIADLAARLRRDGVDVVDLSAGRAAEGTPGAFVDTAVQAMRSGQTHQTMARGTPEYREACARKLLRENGLTADPEREIVATLGCKQGLTLALLATLDPEDEVILEDPGFVSYAPTIRFFGGVPVPVPLRPENGFRWTRDELEGALTERTRAILLCSPQNPTGVVHGEADLEAVAGVARDHDLFVISDEIYERITWNGRAHRSVAGLPGMRSRSIALMGLTKSASMGGWRIGFALAPEPVADAMTTLQQHLMTCAGSFTQAGAAHALGEPPGPELTGMWEEWEGRCRRMTSALNRLPGVSCAMPEGGFYAWADVRDRGEDSEPLATRLLEEEHVAVVPGAAFGPGGEGFLRVTCVKSDADLDRALERMERFFS